MSKHKDIWDKLYDVVFLDRNQNIIVIGDEVQSIYNDGPNNAPRFIGRVSGIMIDPWMPGYKDLVVWTPNGEINHVSGQYLVKVENTRPSEETIDITRSLDGIPFESMDCVEGEQQ